MLETGAVFTLKDWSGREFVFANHLESLGGLAQFMRATIYGKDSYSIQSISMTGRTRHDVTKLGAHFQRLSSYVNAYSSKYQYHPLLSFFFEEYFKHQIQECVGLLPHARFDNSKVVYEVFNDFVEKLRSRAKEVGLKKKVLDWESKINKQKQRLEKLERAMFLHFGRLEVIRLDLKHFADHFDPWDLDKFMIDDEFSRANDFWSLLRAEDANCKSLELRVAFEQVQRDREHFFSNMKGKTSLFEHLLGYAWCIEFTPGAGYHLHVVLFFNGAKVNTPVWHAQQIGEYWKNQITGGHGYYENVNMAWDESNPLCGIGMVNRKDEPKRKNLRERVLGYLTKSSQLVQVLPYKGCNVFGSAILHRGRAKGRGRPRDDETNVLEVDESYPESSNTLIDNGLFQNVLGSTSNRLA